MSTFSGVTQSFQRAVNDVEIGIYPFQVGELHVGVLAGGLQARVILQAEIGIDPALGPDCPGEEAGEITVARQQIHHRHARMDAGKGQKRSGMAAGVPADVGGRTGRIGDRFFDVRWRSNSDAATQGQASRNQQCEFHVFSPDYVFCRDHTGFVLPVTRRDKAA